MNKELYHQNQICIINFLCKWWKLTIVKTSESKLYAKFYQREQKHKNNCNTLMKVSRNKMNLDVVEI